MRSRYCSQALKTIHEILQQARDDLRIESNESCATRLEKIHDLVVCVYLEITGDPQVCLTAKGEALCETRDDPDDRGDEYHKIESGNCMKVIDLVEMLQAHADPSLPVVAQIEGDDWPIIAIDVDIDLDEVDNSKVRLLTD